MTEKRIYVIGNWKMNGSREMATLLLADLAEHWEHLHHEKLVVGVAPPFTLLEASRRALPLGWRFGAQDCSAFASGAYTGDISASMLGETGVDFAILGHSERREFHHEDDDEIRDKIIQTQAGGLTALVCVGETLEQRENHSAEAVVELQIRQGLDSTSDTERLLIAYEPVWAIGSGRAASIKEITDMHDYIKRIAEDHLGKSVPVLYGGSIKASNASEILAIGGVDGVLVGAASLDATEFAAIIEAARETILQPA